MKSTNTHAKWANQWLRTPPKLKILEGTTYLSHHTLKTKLRVNALRAAFSASPGLQPVQLAAQGLMSGSRREQAHASGQARQQRGDVARGRP